MTVHVSVLASLRFALVLLTLSSIQVHADCQLDVRVNNDPPQYMNVDDEWTGRAVELINALLDEAGCTANYVVLPWQRSLIELERGAIDVMMNFGYSAERAGYAHFISPHTYEITVLTVRKNLARQILSLEDLKDLPGKIGFEKGNIYDQAFTRKYNTDKSFRALFVPLPAHDITEMVFRGNLVGELNLAESARYLIDNNPAYAEKLTVLPFHVSRLPTFFAFSKQSVSTELLLRLHAANVRVLARDGYQDILKKWE